jgi:hypothetical protein
MFRQVQWRTYARFPVDFDDAAGFLEHAGFAGGGEEVAAAGAASFGRQPSIGAGEPTGATTGATTGIPAALGEPSTGKQPGAEFE